MNGIFACTFLDRSGNTLKSENGHLLLMPASNMKLITGYAAFNILGKRFKFNTVFSREEDALTVTGDPSPLLSGPDIRHIIRHVSNNGRGISKITFHSEAIDSMNYAPTWEIGDREFTYQAKITPFSVNEGCKPRGTVPLDLDKLVDAHASGNMPTRNPLKLFEASILKASREIAAENDFRETSDTFDHTEEIRDLISHMETVSCNFTAEILQKYLGNRETGRRGTWKNGQKAILGFLKKLHLDTDGIAIVDGSGLSRLNLLNTDILASLVHTIADSGDSEFLDLLPNPGKGTLSNRLQSLTSLGLHAKTGSIGYCASLTGYIEKQQISFSMIINNSTEPSSILTKRIDSFLEKTVRELS